jgi:DNA-binding response OmpR family regulator
MSRNVLLIEDDLVDAMPLRQALQSTRDSGFHVESIRSCAEAVDRLARIGSHPSEAVAALLVNLHLPDSQGLESLERLVRAAPQVPVLVISMGRSLNMQVVAEGVETSGQLDFLQQRNCPEGRGFHFGGPLVANALSQLLECGLGSNP